jgi:hypothetical protein
LKSPGESRGFFVVTLWGRKTFFTIADMMAQILFKPGRDGWPARAMIGCSLACIF